VGVLREGDRDIRRNSGGTRSLDDVAWARRSRDHADRRARHRINVVGFSLETHWGTWMAQAPIEEGEGGSRSFAEPCFRRYPQAEGRFVGLLQTKDREEIPSVLH